MKKAKKITDIIFTKCKYHVGLLQKVACDAPSR